jgi:hypothetical protein
MSGTSHPGAAQGGGRGAQVPQGTTGMSPGGRRPSSMIAVRTRIRTPAASSHPEVLFVPRLRQVTVACLCRREPGYGPARPGIPSSAAPSPHEALHDPTRRGTRRGSGDSPVYAVRTGCPLLLHHADTSLPVHLGVASGLGAGLPQSRAPSHPPATGRCTLAGRAQAQAVPRT